MIKNTPEGDGTRASAVIIDDANLLLATEDKVTAAVEIMFSFSKIASSKAYIPFFIQY